MITAIAIKNLRGIREGELKDLAPLTILVGPNNSGKSTVLDAIMIAASPDVREGLNCILNRRGGLSTPQAWLLRRMGTKIEHEGELTLWEDSNLVRKIEIFRSDRNSMESQIFASAVQSGNAGLGAAYSHYQSASGARRGLFLAQPLKTTPEVRFIDPFGAAAKLSLDALVSRAFENGLMIQAEGFVSELMPTVKAVRILTDKGQPVVHFVYEDGSLPEATAGEGARMLLRIALELAALPGGVELLEEPEIHMHPGAIRLAAKAMSAAVKRGIQLVVSTHNLDMVDFLLDDAARDDRLAEVAVFRLVLDQGQLKSSRFSGEEARFARLDIQEDLR